MGTHRVDSEELGVRPLVHSSVVISLRSEAERGFSSIYGLFLGAVPAWVPAQLRRQHYNS
jgi:hypothetical protein